MINPLQLEFVPLENSTMKLIKSSPVDKGTTISTYGRNPGQLVSRVIQTAQDRKYNLQVCN